MPRDRKRASLVASATPNKRTARALPPGDGESSSVRKRSSPAGSSDVCFCGGAAAADGNWTKVSKNAAMSRPLQGEGARIRASVTSHVSDWLLWQLADSAFPTGGFAHSAGLEAAWQHGEIRNRTELASFADSSLHQFGRSALPFVTMAHHQPDRLDEFDRLCEAFTTNHVANRASCIQGRAFLSAVERIFGLCSRRREEDHFKSEFRIPNSGMERNLLAPAATGDVQKLPPFAHFAPVFGAVMRRLDIPSDTAVRLILFSHLRSVLAAAVRLNIVGPMEAQALQHRLSPRAEQILNRCKSLTQDDFAQTAPLLDLWQGAQDRLYSRLFQS
jgi:urease accessory protein